ncbi:hypothetical protein [Ruegeria sp. SCP11]|uniref:hypothetical protein n=1 Tax=Ruegeria sp. SCP11 TaxID=3141378 RepID=UPI003A96E57E
MSTADLHPMATGHIPSYVTQADGSDFLLTFMFVFTVVVIILIGVGYFTLHSIPEKIAHESNHPQFQLVGILALLALFTHNGLFWVAAILVAGFQFPDVAAPLRAIADAIRSLGNPRPDEPTPTPPTEPTAQQEQ